jgi:hypothetical protein
MKYRARGSATVALLAGVFVSGASGAAIAQPANPGTPAAPAAATPVQSLPEDPGSAKSTESAATPPGGEAPQPAPQGQNRDAIAAMPAPPTNTNTDPNTNTNITNSPPADAPPVARPRPLPHHIGLQFGVRTTNIPASGYDPFAESNGLAQASIAGTFTPWRSLPFSAHAIAEWDVGGSNAEARGATTNLTMFRFALGLEGRYEPISRLYFFAKVAPAALHARSEIEDFALSATLKARSWTWALDTTGGAALRLGDAGKDYDPSATFWLMLEMGYSFAGNAKMVHTPAEIDDEPRRFGSVALPDLNPSGFLTRFAGAVTF